MFDFKTISGIAVALAASSAFAAPVTTYSDVVTNMVIYGTAGGQNGGFTITRDSTDGLELGLRARVRFTNDFDDQGNGTYGSFATSAGPTAVWNFDFSINSNYNGAGTNLSANGLTYRIGLDFDPASGTPTYNYFNLSTTCLDSGFGNNNTLTDAGTKATCNGPTDTSFASLMAGNNLMQNSENLGFFPGFGFDPSVPGQYSFTLQALNARGAVVAESDITVNVPEPDSVALIGVALVGLVATSRRRKARA